MTRYRLAALSFLLTLTAAGSAQAQNALPNSGSDPRLRYAQFLMAEDRNFAAASELLRLQASSGGAQQPDTFYRFLSESLERLGVPNRAAAQSSAFAGDSDDGLVARLNSGLDMLASGNAAGGVTLLDGIGKEKVTSLASASVRDKANVALGYYLLNQREGAASAEVFTRVRSPGPYSSPALLGLGWAMLAPEGGNKGAIRAPAQIVPVPQPGPDQPTVSANRPPLRPGAGTPTDEMRRLAPFRYSRTVVSGDREAALRRALVPWQELIGRDPTDPSVMETLVTIPYALEHLGAHDQAQKYYLRVVDTLEAQLANLRAASAEVSSGVMAQRLSQPAIPNNGWPWWLGDFPEPRWWLTKPPGAPPNFYLDRLIGDRNFREALYQFHELQVIDAKMVEHLNQLQTLGDARAQDTMARINALRPQLASGIAQQRQIMEMQATAELNRIRKLTETYLVEAHFALARMHDRPEDAEDINTLGGKKK